MTVSPVPRPRARRAGLAIPGLPTGELNAIVDVPGVRVGHVTLFAGEGELEVGVGPVRTGCTAIIPAPGDLFARKVPAAVHIINGFGKAVGLPQVRELGLLETPIILTNTLSVPRAADGLLDYALAENSMIGRRAGTVNPVVGECNDGYLNDIRGRHLEIEHVLAAIDSARADNVREGAVGAGTGMRCFGFKGGIGTSSRVVRWERPPVDDEDDPRELTQYVVGALVLANFGSRRDLRVIGAPVGENLADDFGNEGDHRSAEDGSIIIVLATDAPLSGRQLERLAKRAALGLGRCGSVASHGSGDFVIAFSNAQLVKRRPDTPVMMTRKIYDAHPIFTGLFRGAVQATEEAVLNALFVADTVTGRDGHTAVGLPVQRVLDLVARG